MIGDAAKNILDSNFQIITLMGPGVDPHLYKATPQDLKALRNADIIVTNGLHLEGKMQDIFNKLSKNKLVITLSDALSKKSLRKGDQMSHDPHLWFDVSLWMQCVEYFGYKIRLAYPPLSKGIKVNSNKYLDQLYELHQDVIKQTSTLKPENKYLITAHDAFGYFGDAYSFNVLALKGMSTVSEANLKHVNEITQVIIANKVKSIYPESSIPEGNILGAIEACKQLGHEVTIGKTLYSDAMGDQNSSEGTYIGMVKYNVSAIIEGLK